jgi:aminobenzoyl-glutamate utilization protein B
MPTPDRDAVATRWVEENAARLSEWTRVIFDKAECAWREYESAAWYVALLREHGFEVEEGSAGMPTAFAARWSNGPGAVAAAYAEYDAVPGNCQAATIRQEPRPGLNIHAGGHTDPHSALGTSALGGLLAAKAAMEATGIPGTLRFFGEPAEKVRGSKPIHAAAGYYDGVDGLVSFHPCYMLPLCNTVSWDTHCGAAYAMVYRFTCPSPETWLPRTEGQPIPQAHSAVRAHGANDALFTMYNASKALRDSILPHSGGWSISEAILTAGQATADNLPARLGEIQYIIRVPTVQMAEQATLILDRNAAAAAQLAHCAVERIWVSKSRPGLANHAISRMVYDKLAAVGAPLWGERAKAIAREMQAAVGLTPTAEPYLPDCERLMDPEEAERILRRDLPPSQVNYTSDDYTDMCWHAPTARLYVARPMLAGPPGFAYPDWVMNALGGIPETIDPMVLCAAKTVAHSLLAILGDADLRAAARAEFEERTGGGVGGSRWIPPLCDYPPPIGLRWPEYVTTARGREWWIPTAGY